MRMKLFLMLTVLLSTGLSLEASGFQEFAQEFWTWRTLYQPFSGDDIPRVVRKPGTIPDWSKKAVIERISRAKSFEERWRAFETAGWSVPEKVDYRLVGSAIARVRWELEVERGWRRNPYFYVDQTLGSFFELLLQPPPFDEERSREIVFRMKAIPQTLREGKNNLDQMAAPFIRSTVASLQDIGSRLTTVANELTPLLTEEARPEFRRQVFVAILELQSFSSWLRAQVRLSQDASGRFQQIQEETAVGRDAYTFYLRQVALLNSTPEELLLLGRQEWERSVTFETLEKAGNADLPELPIFESSEEQQKAEREAELAIREFLKKRDVLTIPEGTGHYLNLPMPGYLAPLAFLGVTDDLTSPERLGEDGVSYILSPSPELPYFRLSTARDPRPIIVHEGIPGHFFQLVRSWSQQNAVRRFFYDSIPNEGIGFYVEEMLLQLGLFDDSPKTREIIYSFMRLRALRVEIDINLALGEYTIEEAADRLESLVPMDAETAKQEAVFFASTPGQAISYQVGKSQIMRLLADARRVQGDGFELKAFHDFLLKNGNVPLSLLRWELLGLEDALPDLDREVTRP